MDLWTWELDLLYDLEIDVEEILMLGDLDSTESVIAHYQLL